MVDVSLESINDNHFIYSANSLKCYENRFGAEPKQKTCEAPRDKFCGFVHNLRGIMRMCSSDEEYIGGKRNILTARCRKFPKVTEEEMNCLCDTDFCNHICKAVNCTKVPEILYPGQGVEECEQDCKSPTGQGNGEVGKVSSSPGGNGGKTTGESTSGKTFSSLGGNEGKTKSEGLSGETNEDGASGKTKGTNQEETTKSRSQKNLEPFRSYLACLIFTTVIFKDANFQQIA